ncbi:hypothetical protein KIN20_027263 [Parelaphostrongylus tenuis]|uniref:Uncharacterized protein n=1 Tax=Parelaphostrongylus tenuis TaxID=148309 RepID=A0AAD5WDN2_PARTN|nr:hypothetical protein KIN20_027263 [Parelaphostrongylus tenuis]
MDDNMDVEVGEHVNKTKENLKTTFHIMQKHGNHLVASPICSLEDVPSKMVQNITLLKNSCI